MSPTPVRARHPLNSPRARPPLLPLPLSGAEAWRCDCDVCPLGNAALTYSADTFYGRAEQAARARARETPLGPVCGLLTGHVALCLMRVRTHDARGRLERSVSYLCARVCIL